MDLQQLLLHVALAVEVKIAVIREIQDRVLIGLGMVMDAEAVALPAEAHRERERAGIALLAVGRDARKYEAVGILVRIPDVFVKAAQAAVQMVHAVVFCKGIAFSVQLERRAADAVGKAADGCAEVAGRFDIALQRVIAEHHVGQYAVPVRHLKAADGCAVVQQLRAQAVFVFHRPAVYCRSVFKCPKGTLCKLHIGNLQSYLHCAADATPAALLS